MPGPNRRTAQNREEREELVARIRNILGEASGECHQVGGLIPEIPENQGSINAWSEAAEKIDALQIMIEKLAF